MSPRTVWNHQFSLLLPSKQKRSLCRRHRNRVPKVDISDPLGPKTLSDHRWSMPNFQSEDLLGLDFSQRTPSKQKTVRMPKAQEPNFRRRAGDPLSPKTSSDHRSFIPLESEDRMETPLSTPLFPQSEDVEQKWDSPAVRRLLGSDREFTSVRRL